MADGGGQFAPFGGTATDIAGLLAAVGLAGTETLHPKALSLGMARRVALVRALLGKPRMLVLDEPFASLDPRAAGELAALVVRAARCDGALVLLSTHDLDQGLGIADRLLVLSGNAGEPRRRLPDQPGRAGAERAGETALQAEIADPISVPERRAGAGGRAMSGGFCRNLQSDAMLAARYRLPCGRFCSSMRETPAGNSIAEAGGKSDPW